MAIHNIHLVSDSTGETLQAIARAATAPFGSVDPLIHQSVFVRTETDLDAVIDRIERKPGVTLYTLANSAMAERLRIACARLDCAAVSVLDPIIATFARAFNSVPAHEPGMQHRLNSAYYDRIAALDFAMANDDGALGQRLLQSDVVLVGVSRTSKTPTSIYLAYRGIKAANVPLVAGRTPDPLLFKAMENGVPMIGLVASPNRLAQIRRERLEGLSPGMTHDYVDIDRVRDEVAESRLFFDQHHIPVIDVTRRSIEETAAKVLAILRDTDRTDP